MKDFFAARKKGAPSQFQQTTPSIANILFSLFGGQQIGAGFGDLESEIRQGIGTQQQSLAQALRLLSPFRGAGVTATGEQLAGLQQEADPAAFINQALSQFQQSPAQRATIQSGLTAVQNRLGAQGLGQSGAEQKALEQFAQQQTAGQQQQFLQNVLGLQQQRLAGLGQIAGRGLSAAGIGAQGTLQTGQNIADLLESLGETQLKQQETGALGQGGLFGSLGSLAGTIGTFL